MFPTDAFDPETLRMLTRALDEAWVAVQAALGVRPVDPIQLKERLAVRILHAANQGERDPKRLKLIALQAI
jgi:hypothetical protein